MSMTPRTDKAESVTYVGLERVVPAYISREIEIELNAAIKLCEIYWEIAAKCVGEVKVREMRDARLAAITAPGAGREGA